MQETSRDLRDCTSNTLETQERGQLNAMIAAYFSHRARWRHWKNSGRSEALPQFKKLQQTIYALLICLLTYVLTY